MPKNIVVFSDGTGQEGGKGINTNVYKLFNMVEDRTDKQIAFYDRGLGTGFRKITGKVAGMGISKNIQDCYEFIFNNFKSEDQIYLFGFSRGATTVRSLAGFIHLFGILPQSRPELIKQAYRIYTTNPIESTFATVRLRHDETKSNGSRKACLAMVFKLTESAQKRWRRLNRYELIKDVIAGVTFIDGEKQQAA